MIEPGLTNERTWLIDEKHLASAFGSGLVDVLATPVLVGFCEQTARTAVDPLLGEGQKTVGTSITLRHTAATPLGMKVTVRAKLVEVERRRLRFEIEAHDEQEQIAEGQHERFIIDTERFERRIAEKRRKVA
ncbi:MAG TPA: thioesterase family protein [Candidatus Heimdallarchaeota archaeon]|nr:thioesterase family protein [Candidatus Heimdallarchaeota archaeon]